MNHSATALAVMRGLLNGGDASVVDRHVDLDLVMYHQGRTDTFDRYLRWSRENRPVPTLYTPYRWAADGDVVGVHGLYRWSRSHRPGWGRGFVAVDVFRFVRERIVEHWHVEEPLVVETASSRGTIEGERPLATSGDADVEIVDAYLRDAVPNADEALIEHLVADDLRQHRPDLEDGRDALMAEIRSGSASVEVLHLVGEGPLVIALSDHHSGPLAGSRVADVFGVQRRQIVEQWRVVDNPATAARAAA